MGELLRRELATAGVDFGASSTQIVPVLCGTNEAALHVAGALQKSGFAVRAIRPPTVPAGKARVRVSLTVKITREEILRLASAIRGAFETLSGRPTAVHA
jgi:8-amino-7-oxononanoate synthase